MSPPVLLLAPSQGLGGGIERYVDTIEAALTRQSVACRRLDLLRPGVALGLPRKAAFAAEVRRAVRTAAGPVRLVFAHRNLLPLLRLVTGHPHFGAATVLLHGSEIWASRRARAASILRRADVRVLASSSFSAGALGRTCRAAVLHPGVTERWYRMLVAAGRRPRPARDEIRLVTTFRLGSWHTKGLPALLQAVCLLGDPRVNLTVCGSGPVPADLRTEVERYPWCRLAADLSDAQLAEQLADADLFVLGTRTRSGRAASGEGFGLVLLEAQLAGTPVVAPAYGGSNDAFAYGITGLAPVDETPEALGAVLTALVTDQAVRARMAGAAAEWSRRRFEPEAYSRRVVEMVLGLPDRR